MSQITGKTTRFSRRVIKVFHQINVPQNLTTSVNRQRQVLLTLVRRTWASYNQRPASNGQAIKTNTFRTKETYTSRGTQSTRVLAGLTGVLQFSKIRFKAYYHRVARFSARANTLIKRKYPYRSQNYHY